MSPTFTDADIGKTVESADGEPLGVVAAVDEETAYVEPGVSDSSEADLGRERASEEAISLADDAVDRLDDETIRLEEAFPAESLVSGDETERSASSKHRDADYVPGESVAGSPTDSPDENAEVDVGESGPGTEPEALDEDVDDGALMDAGAVIDGDEERRDVGERDPLEEGGGPDEGDAEADSTESSTRRDVDVDPTEVTDGEPDVEVRPEEDVGSERTRDDG